MKVAKSILKFDETLAAPLIRDQSLSSFRKLFCPRCCIYGCQLHSRSEIVDVNARPRKDNVKELKPFTQPCSSTCYLVRKTEPNTQVRQKFIIIRVCSDVDKFTDLMVFPSYNLLLFFLEQRESIYTK